MFNQRISSGDLGGSAWATLDLKILHLWGRDSEICTLTSLMAIFRGLKPDSYCPELWLVCPFDGLVRFLIIHKLRVSLKFQNHVKNCF